MGSLALVDLAAVLTIVLGAGGYLVWYVFFKKSAPACCPTPAKSSVQPGGNVVLDDKLAKALARARARRS